MSSIQASSSAERSRQHDSTSDAHIEAPSGHHEDASALAVEHECVKCGKHLASKQNLRRHEKEVHAKLAPKYLIHKKEGTRVVCRICNLTFSHHSKLKRHYRNRHTYDERKANGIPDLSLLQTRRS